MSFLNAIITDFFDDMENRYFNEPLYITDIKVFVEHYIINDAPYHLFLTEEEMEYIIAELTEMIGDLF